MPTLHTIGKGTLGSWRDKELGQITVDYAVERESGRGVQADRVICHATADGYPVLWVDHMEADLAIKGDNIRRLAIGFKLYTWRRKHRSA